MCSAYAYKYTCLSIFSHNILVFKFTQYRNADKKKTNQNAPWIISNQLLCGACIDIFNLHHVTRLQRSVDAAFPYTFKMDFYIIQKAKGTHCRGIFCMIQCVVPRRDYMYAHMQLKINEILCADSTYMTNGFSQLFF